MGIIKNTSAFSKKYCTTLFKKSVPDTGLFFVDNMFQEKN